MNMLEMKIPDSIRTESELENFYSEPYPETVQMMKRLDGDIMILGAGGKMGPSLAHLAANSVKNAGSGQKVLAVSRFGDEEIRHWLEDRGVTTISCDLSDYEAVQSLPRIRNVIFMAGRKFGESGSQSLTWLMNTIVPGNVARIFADSRIVVFSTGCIYDFARPEGGGSKEEDLPHPVGEYAYSCLARERVFEYYSIHSGTGVLFFRLNYAIDLRYGVLLDIGEAVYNGLPVDLSVSTVNIIWQGDANNRALLSLEHAASPPFRLNVAGSDMISVKEIAERFAGIFGCSVHFTGSDSGKAYLSNAERSVELFGSPRISLDKMIDWVASWIRTGGRTLLKPTKFQVTDGNYLS